MTDLLASDQEFAVVLEELGAAGEECRLKMDGRIITGPSRRLARKRAMASASLVMSAAEAKRARKAAKLREKGL